MENDILQAILESPRESLETELKQWIDPTSDEGKCKITKTCLAMRNHDGGQLLIGVHDDGRLDTTTRPTNLRELFTQDCIQAIVSRFASEVFEVHLEFRKKDGLEYPIICVPSGITTPVCAKRPFGDSDKCRIEENAIYVRTLNSNGMPSSSKATRNDWKRLVEKCFANREADIGEFIRRHIAGANSDFVTMLLGKGAAKDDQDNFGHLRKKGIESWSRFQQIRQKIPVQRQIGGYRWVAAKILDDLPETNLSKEFLLKLNCQLPQLTGWPPWSLTELGPPSRKPEYQSQLNLWEATYYSPESQFFEYWQLSASGYLFEVMAFEEDFERVSGQPPFCHLLRQVDRVAETIWTAIAIARNLGATDQADIQFVFYWHHLQNRIPMGFNRLAQPSNADHVYSAVQIPICTAKGAIWQFVKKATQKLMLTFGGFELPENQYKQIVEGRLVHRHVEY